MNVHQGDLRATLFAGLLIVFTNAALANDVTVTVKRGDTLQTISREYYGTTRRWNDIFTWNQTAMKNSSELFIGMKLVVKDPRLNASASATPDVQSVAPAAAVAVEEKVVAPKTEKFSEEASAPDSSTSAESNPVAEPMPAQSAIRVEAKVATDPNRAPASSLTDPSSAIKTLHAYHEMEF